MPENDETFTRVGQIVSVFGLKGQVKVLPLTDFLDRFKKGTRLRLKDNWVTIDEVNDTRMPMVIKFSGIDTINQAEELRGSYLEASASSKPKLEKDEYFTQDLIGLTVETFEGEVLGKVDEVIAAPAHDLLKIGEILIPAVKAFVKKVDIKDGKITVELIFGMRPGEE
jgi:16S rRNA processing protein RimM